MQFGIWNARGGLIEGGFFCKFAASEVAAKTAHDIGEAVYVAAHAATAADSTGTRKFFNPSKEA